MPLCSIVPRMRVNRDSARFRKILPNERQPELDPVDHHPPGLASASSAGTPTIARPRIGEHPPPVADCMKWLTPIRYVVSDGQLALRLQLARRSARTSGRRR